MNFPDSIAAARALQLANDLSEETALHFMARIGDTPELADDGKVIVRDEGGKEIARVIFPDLTEPADAQ
jgi:hypothetical protein